MVPRLEGPRATPAQRAGLATFVGGLAAVGGRFGPVCVTSSFCADADRLGDAREGATAYVTGTAQPKMNQAKMNMIPVALPPPEEQALIVAKVEYLMKLCDDLEAELRRAEDRASKLVEAVVQEMVS